MTISRRDTLKGMAATGLLPFAPALAQTPRQLKVNLLGFVLGIQTPANHALFDLMPGMGYAPVTSRMDQIRTLTQTLVAGAAELGETDPIVTMAAVESGADLKIVAPMYLNTSLVIMVNADKVREIKDLQKQENVIAVNNKGDITHVMMVGPLVKAGVDVKKLNIVEIGGSGARMRALVSGRVQAVPVHFDQAAEIAKQGNFKVLIEPWKEYRAWINEVWVVRGGWLKEKQNERAVIDFLKAQMTAFRRANEDLAWYTQAYRKHATLPNAKEATEESLRPLWTGLRDEVKAWPRTIQMRADDYRELMPLYVQAEAIAGRVKVEQVIETSLAQQAASELGA
jgi:NitT/TauT family transport system substrate-binding protein